jgi:hypothetical protein
MDPKELKKLVKTCRSLGINHYKGEGFEFTLGDAPEKPKRITAKSVTNHEQPEEIESDTLTEDQLLMWSVSHSDPSEQPGIGV